MSGGGDLIAKSGVECADALTLPMANFYVHFRRDTPRVLFTSGPIMHFVSDLDGNVPYSGLHIRDNAANVGYIQVCAVVV